MAAPSLQGDDAASCLGEGAPSGDSVVPAPGGPAARVGLILEAVVGVLQRVPVAGPGLVRLQAGAQALRTGGRPLMQRLMKHGGRYQIITELHITYFTAV